VIKKIYPLLMMYPKIWLRCKAYKTLLISLFVLSIEAVWLSDAISDQNEAASLFQDKKNNFDLAKKNLALLEQNAKNNQNHVLFADFKRKKFDQVIPDHIVQHVLKKLSEAIQVRFNEARIVSDDIWDKDLNIFVKKIIVSVQAKKSMTFYQFAHMLQQKLPGLVIFKDITFQNNEHNPDLSHGQITFLWARKKISHPQN
jgi:hypothetical protein